MQSQLNQTMREEGEINKHQESLYRVPKEGIASYEVNLHQVKKHFPAFSSSKGKRIILFDDGKSPSYKI